jgi:hypothetical protein
VKPVPEKSAAAQSVTRSRADGRPTIARYASDSSSAALFGIDQLDVSSRMKRVRV